MATFVQSTTGFNASGSNQNLFTSVFPGATTSGNAIAACICLDGASATPSALTDTQGNTYTLLASYSASSMTILFYIAYNITGGSCTVQATEPFLDGEIFAEEWSGLPVSAAFDVSITKTGTSAATITSGTITTAQSNEVIFAAEMLQIQTNTPSLGSGYSNLLSVASSFTSAAMESKALAAAGGTTASFGMTNTSTTYIMLVIALKTTASSGGFVSKPAFFALM